MFDVSAVPECERSSSPRWPRPPACETARRRPEPSAGDREMGDTDDADEFVSDGGADARLDFLAEGDDLVRHHPAILLSLDVPAVKAGSRQAMGWARATRIPSGPRT